MTDLWFSLKSEKKPIFLYGMGNGADKIQRGQATPEALISG